ncbi:CPCC family cysteine-rich protein [Pectobacterium cacticida]|uniref:CPCC family cysteine-rich protein n=1 Tax=Pectobacterium cacticida TaxID=69221 RepID=UPI003985B358
MTNEYNYPCPCCGKHEFEVLGEYDVCSNCGWEDDPFQSKNPDRFGFVLKKKSAVILLLMRLVNLLRLMGRCIDN